MTPARGAWLVVAAALLLAGCDRGPGVDVLRDDLQRALDAMDDGLLRVAALAPQGTGPAPGADEQVVYANVTLELARDHDFGGWDGATVGTLASTLGATSRGVAGVRDGGNAAGDRLRVHASAVYARDGGAWRHVGGDAPAAGAGGPRADDDAPLLARIESILARGQDNQQGAGRRLVERELRAALDEIERQVAATEAGAVVAAGPLGGEYSKIALGLARAAAAHGIRLAVHHSDGSVENVRLVASGGAGLAIAQSDVLALAYRAEGPFAGAEPQFDVVALAALYPEPVHVIVPAGSPVTTIAGLAGRRVALGGPESGTRVTARRVLAAHGVRVGRLAAVDESDLETAAARLARGEIDAMFATIGAPAGTLRELAVRHRVRLLALDERAIAALAAGVGGLERHVIPRGTYRGQREPVATVATAAVLIAPRSLLDGLVEQALDALFFELDHRTAGSLQGGLIGPRTATRGLPIPLHRAAERYYEAAAAREPAAAR